jgi:hypothetical protein
VRSRSARARRAGARSGWSGGLIGCWLTRRDDPPRQPQSRPAPQPTDEHFPAYVTDGMNPDGTLRVLIFNSREEADAAGFDWVGR